MSLRDAIERKLIKQKLWSDPEFAVEESLLGMAMFNRGLIVLDGCQAILRKDYDNMPEKVKIITGGGAGNEPAYSGFVGPGMLTASISGSIHTSPPSHSILNLIKEIGTNHHPGVLIIIENRAGYRINFTKAVLRAENKNVKVKLILVGNRKCSTSAEKSSEECMQSNIFFILKIAGAMAEEGKTLNEIYSFCTRLVTSGEITNIDIGIRSLSQNLGASYEMEIGPGIHGEAGFTRMPFSSLKNTVSILLKIMLKLESKNESEYFVAGHKIAVIVNNTGGCSQLETNIFAMEVLQQLSDLKFVVERAYVGNLMTVLDQKAFHVSLIDFSFDPNMLRYLDEPVKTPAWPRLFSLQDIRNNWESEDSLITLGRYVKENVEELEVEPLGPSMNEKSAQAFLMILSFACEAVIACSEQINIMDEEFGDGDCGTTLAAGAKDIKSAIMSNQISGINPFVTFTQISRILDKKMGGLQGGIYSLFFEAIAKVFSQHPENDPIDSFLWLKALTVATETISHFGGAKEGDRTMLDPLLSFQRKLEDSLNKHYHPVDAFGEAVKVAEECAIKTLFMTEMSNKTIKRYQYPDPGAHAVGIWMRAAYEGVKLKFSCECETAI